MVIIQFISLTTSILFAGGAVLAAELKSNANKLAQWTVRAILAGAEKVL
jgi:hypothetical protein